MKLALFLTGTWIEICLSLSSTSGDLALRVIMRPLKLNRWWTRTHMGLASFAPGQHQLKRQRSLQPVQFLNNAAPGSHNFYSCISESRVVLHFHRNTRHLLLQNNRSPTSTFCNSATKDAGSPLGRHSGRAQAMPDQHPGQIHKTMTNDTCFGLHHCHTLVLRSTLSQHWWKQVLIDARCPSRELDSRDCRQGWVGGSTFRILSSVPMQGRGNVLSARAVKLCVTSTRRNRLQFRSSFDRATRMLMKLCH